MTLRLSRSFYTQEPVALARALLGQTLVRVLPDGSRLSGRIVEVEAYLGARDKAAHTFNGRRTARNASMWLEGGHAYIYFTYGMHYCFNIVAQQDGEPTAVLIRAIAPQDGIDQMRRHRNRDKIADLCSGPAKLCQALALNKALDGVDLVTHPHLFVEEGTPVPSHQIARTPRIGVEYAGAWARRLLRFYDKTYPHMTKR